jgi:hypothetical protein
VLSKGKIPKNVAIKKTAAPVITAENMDQHIFETEFDRFLRNALSSGDYKLAVRIYYLKIIKSLAEHKLIKWKKDKTNATYLREMRQHNLYEEFRNLTAMYEKIWFGDIMFTESDFGVLKPTLDDSINKFNKG